MNPKRIHRIRRREGHVVRPTSKRRREVETASDMENAIRAEAKNVVWAWDVISGRIGGGRSAKWLTLLDEYTRELLALEVGGRTSAGWVIDVLEHILTQREPPRYLRSDNTRPFVTEQVEKWMAMAGIGTITITPGAPWENGYVEAFHSRFRDEFLNLEVFESLEEAKRRTDVWRDFYNHVRPHGALGYLTPAEFAMSK